MNENVKKTSKHMQCVLVKGEKSISARIKKEFAIEGKEVMLKVEGKKDHGWTVTKVSKDIDFDLLINYYKEKEEENEKRRADFDNTRCEICKFSSNDSFFVCKKSAPTGDFSWPKVTEDDLCGEFEHAEEFEYN